MTPEKLEIILDVMAVLLAAFVVYRQFSLFRNTMTLTAAFFFFAMVSLLLAYAYWLAYTLLRPNIRMPLAANMIGECAVFLLLSETLKTAFRESRIPVKREIVFTLLFVIASIALWIAWSGEWIQDILGGIAFGYYLCVCIWSLKQTSALSEAEWIVLGSSCAVLIVGQTLLFFVQDFLKPMLDLFNYVLMFALNLVFLGKSIQAAIRNSDPDTQLALSVSTHGWCMSVMYMSSGYYYTAAMLHCLVTLPLMLHAVRKEVEHR